MRTDLECHARRDVWSAELCDAFGWAVDVVDLVNRHFELNEGLLKLVQAHADLPRKPPHWFEV